MKTRTLFGTIAFLTLAVQANAFTIGLGGTQVNGEGFNVFSVSNSSTEAVSSISFDFIYSTSLFAANGALGSELIVQLGHIPTDTFIQLGTVGGVNDCSGFSVICDFDLMLPSANGEFAVSGTVDFDQFASDLLVNLIADGSGQWEVLIGTINDGGLGPEGQFLSGTLTVNQVPLPAAIVLFISALAGLGTIHRRRG